MFGRMGMPELVVIMVIALMIFGPAKLPEIGRAFGKAIGEFKSHAKKISEEVEEEVKDIEKSIKE